MKRLVYNLNYAFPMTYDEKRETVGRLKKRGKCFQSPDNIDISWLPNIRLADKAEKIISRHFLAIVSTRPFTGAE